MPYVFVAHSIHEIDAADWRRCFRDELEGWNYYQATERAPPPGFSFRYYCVMENGCMIAGVPGFHMRYRLETTLQGWQKRLLQKISTILPKLLVLPLICLGSPIAECCRIGFAPDVPAERRSRLVQLLLAAFENDAKASKIGFQAIKDIADDQLPLWRLVTKNRFQVIPGLPTAVLLLNFSSQTAYLGQLSSATRKDMRRKLRKESLVRIEHRKTIEDVRNQVAALYASTFQRSQLQFERLPPDWFVNVLNTPDAEASCFLYWVGERLAGFNIVLHNDRLLIDKFIGLDSDLARQHNLYFLSWFANISFCLERGIRTYQSGQAEYGIKKHLGCQFLPTWIMFRHTGWVKNGLLRMLSRFLRLERYDPNLATIVGKSP